MGSSGNLLPAAYGAQAVSQIGSAYAQSEIIQAQGDYSSRMADLNAKAAEFESDEVIKQGDQSANVQRRRTRQLIGEQRVSLAAQGIDVSSGSALNIQEETRAVGETEALTIKNNAWRTAWGLKNEANQSRAAGQIASLTASASARNTLISGGIEAIGSGIKAGISYTGRNRSTGRKR